MSVSRHGYVAVTSTCRAEGGSDACGQGKRAGPDPRLFKRGTRRHRRPRPHVGVFHLRWRQAHASGHERALGVRRCRWGARRRCRGGRRRLHQLPLAASGVRTRVDVELASGESASTVVKITESEWPMGRRRRRQGPSADRGLDRLPVQLEGLRSARHQPAGGSHGGHALRAPGLVRRDPGRVRRHRRVPLRPPILTRRLHAPAETPRPRQDSNLCTRLRRPMLYPLSYEGRIAERSRGGLTPSQPSRA